MKAIKTLLSTVLSLAFSINVISVVAPKEAVSAEISSQNITEDIRNGFINFQTGIDIKQYEMSMDNFQQLNDIINQVILDPDLFYLNLSSIKCSGAYDANGNVILSQVKVEYGNTYEECKPEIDEFNQKTDEIINNNINDSMTDIEKALKLHDYLVLNTKYDTTDTIPDLNGGSSAYDIMVKGNGVCQGYAQAYRYLLGKVGINAIMVTSDEMVHAWNLVQIDGQWYHVDVTWDDPVPDAQGRVNHEYFMLSDSEIGKVTETRENEHYNWNSKGLTATDTRFDNAFWNDVNSEIYISAGRWYFIDNKGMYSTYIPSENSVNTNVSIDDEKWYVWESVNQYWGGKYSSLIISGDMVYYNTPTMIYKMNLDGSNKQSVQYVNPYDTKGYVYGMILNDDMLYAVIKQAPSDEGTLYEIMNLHLNNYSYIDTLLKSISDLKDGGTSVFNMSQEPDKVLPAEAINMIKGRNVNLIFEFDGYSWAINGQNVKASQNLNLQIDENKGIIPSDLLLQTAADNKYVELNLSHDGQFGLSADVSYYIGKEYAKKSATVYYYNEAERKLDKETDIRINDDGSMKISLEHASNYAVVVNENTENYLGDINEDGRVDITDLTLISLYLLGDVHISESGTVNADVNRDGYVDLADLAMFKQYVIKDITSFIQH